ncbi:MAG: DUF1836 domain-containing protein [Eubacteriales bacterium]|nr:DUF1836 domain-containing protein [Eubacteriales bacterium]
MPSAQIKSAILRTEQILRYRLPAWEELPDQIRSREFQAFIQDELGWLLREDELLTGYMLQNYLKWNVLLPLEGRKYSREHVAWVLTITLLKRVVTLEEVKRGILLQKSLQSAEEAYEVFAEQFAISLELAFEPIHHFLKKKYTHTAPKLAALEGQLNASLDFIKLECLAPGTACRAVAWQLLCKEWLHSEVLKKIVRDKSAEH